MMFWYVVNLKKLENVATYKKSLDNPIWATQETKKQPGSPEHMRLLPDTGLIGVAISGPQWIAKDLRKQFSSFHTNRTDWCSFWSPSTTDPSKYRKKVPECILSKIYHSSICAFHPYLAAKLPFLYSRNKNPGSGTDTVLDKKGATVFPTGCFSVSTSHKKVLSL